VQSLLLSGIGVKTPYRCTDDVDFVSSDVNVDVCGLYDTAICI